VDPDTARIVADIAANATQTGALFGMTGAIAGALIGAFGGFLAARANLSVQRALARDADRRRRREARVQPLIDQVKRRSALRVEATLAIHDRQLASPLVERLAQGEGYDRDIAYTAIGSKEVLAAFAKLRASDAVVVKALHAALDRRFTDTDTTAMTATDQRLNEVAFYEAAEAYIDSG
jgi:hypothetical protein